MKKRRDFTVIVERDEDGWLVATVPELLACYTQARSLDQLMERIQEVIAGCLAVDGEPEGVTELVGVQRVSFPYAAAA